MDGLDSDNDFEDEDGWDDGEQYTSLSNMPAEEEQRKEKVAQSSHRQVAWHLPSPGKLPPPHVTTGGVYQA